jgi:hypothetical protein
MVSLFRFRKGKRTFAGRITSRTMVRKNPCSGPIPHQEVTLERPNKGIVATGSTRQFFRGALSIDAKGLVKTILLLFLYVTFVDRAAAQELTPRIYWPSPEGTRVLVAGYSYTSGDILFDRSIPLSDVDSQLNVGILAYLQTINLWGRSGNFLLELPYVWGRTEGFIQDIPARSDFSDFGDIRVTGTINLLGAPSMTVEDFLDFRAKPRSIIGASIKLVIPTGDYDSDKLINIGANRWATRLQVGTIYPMTTTWLFELEAGLWLFSDDDDFLPGKREQEPIYSVQTNLIKRFSPGFWASLDLSFFSGGRQTIGGDRLNDSQRNAKVGGTIVFPFAKKHAVKIGYANGAVTKYGSDFDQFLVTYQVLLK